MTRSGGASSLRQTDTLDQPGPAGCGWLRRGKKHALPSILNRPDDLAVVGHCRTDQREQALAMERQRIPVGGEVAGFGCAEEMGHERDCARMHRRSSTR